MTDNGFSHSKRKQWWLLLILLLAMLLKCLIIYNFRQLAGDKIPQLAGAVSIAKNKGYALPFVHPDDLSAIQYERVIEWPPLYSYLVAPFLRMTGFDLDRSAYMVDVM